MNNHIDIAIIGGSFAGLAAYRQLRKRLGKKVRIKVIDRETHFTYIPALHECICRPGHLDSIQFPLKDAIGEDYINTTVSSIDKNTITDATERQWSFGHALICTGSRTQLYDNASFKKYGLTRRHAEDVAILTKRMESAKNVTVIGGGFTGIEVASMLAVRYSDVVVTLLHSRERVLHTYKPSVSRYVHRWLESHGVRIILDTKATELTNDTIIRDNGTTLASDVSILTAGIEPNNEVHDETLTFDFYRAQESDRILMAGDVAHHGLAATAHNAMIEGRRMADLIADDRLGLDRTYKPIQNRTMLALALGPRDGLFTWNNGHIPLPYLTGIAKKLVQHRVVLEYRYGIQLPV